MLCACSLQHPALLQEGAQLVIANAVLCRNVTRITAPQWWARGNLVRTVETIVAVLSPGRYQADDATVPGGAGIQGGDIGCQLMHVGSENGAGPQAPQDTHDVLGDIKT